MVSEVLGAASMIFVKDEDGLYAADPKRDSSARFIPKITAQELLALDRPELIIDRSVIESMVFARNTRRIQIINGLKPELLGRALAGEPVGIFCGIGERCREGEELYREMFQLSQMHCDYEQ